ncbi:MAG: hypothetical protein JST73_12540 [Actinobacteria bacterium]|nr:hypothetical protein [Actinomycetota bacterium]
MNRFATSSAQSARVLAIVAAGLIGATAAVAGRRLMRWSRSATLAFVALVIIRPNRFAFDVWLFGGSGVALAESISVAVIFAMVILGICLVGRPSRWVVPLLGAWVVCATLLRPDGLAVGIAYAIAILHRDPRSDRPRSRRDVIAAAALAATGPVTLVLWPKLNGAIWGAAPTVRAVAWHPTGSIGSDTVRVMAGWFAGPEVPAIWLQWVLTAGCVVVPALVALVPALHRRAFGPEDRLGRLATVCGVMVVLQWSIVVVTRLLLDRTTDVDVRHLLGAQPFAYALAACVVTGVFGRFVRVRATSRWLRLVAVVAAAGVLVALSAPTLADAPRYRRIAAGQVYSDSRRPVDAQRPVTVITNVPEAFWTSSARVLLLPKPTSTTSGRPNRQFDDQLEALAVYATGRPVAVVVLPALPNLGLSGREAVRRLRRTGGLELVAQCGSGAEIWSFPDHRGTVAATVRCRAG